MAKVFVSRMTLFIVIPFLNEAENFVRLAQELREFIDNNLSKSQYLIIFVNDGSADNSVVEVHKKFADFNYQLLNHVTNMGPGAAFQTAFSEILKAASENDFVLTIEADNTSNLSIVPSMLRRSKEGYDVVLASPYMYGGTITNTPFIRRFLSFFANLFLRELLDLRGLFTISSFFRLYKVSVLRHIAKNFDSMLIQRKGFEGKVELLMKLVFCKIAISEIPLVLDTSRRKGKSKMKILRTIFDLLSLYFQKKSWKEQAIVYKS
jgi:dolichol-phosphate mannosyltransferase